MQNNLLVVDDDPVIREILEFNLFHEGFQVTTACSAEEARKKLNSEHALILLDIMMGGISGYKFAEELRKKSNQVPIIFLTAKDTENDMLTGFSVGGDDYIAKPFSIKEVIVRVKAVLKRQKTEEEFVLNDFVLNDNRKDLHINNIKIELTKTEYKLLAFMVQNSHQVISREEFIENIWRETPFITERTVDVHIARLRKKLGKYAIVLSNQAGFGYRFNISAI